MSPKVWKTQVQVLAIVAALATAGAAWSDPNYCSGYGGSDECCDVSDPCELGFNLDCYAECDVCAWETADCDYENSGIPYIRVFEVGDETEGWGEGATCTVVDAYGVPVSPAISDTSDAYGVCQFDGVSNGYSARVSKAGFHNSYYFDLVTSWIHTIPYYSENVIDYVFGSLSAGNGLILGHVAWAWFHEEEEELVLEVEPVGCAGLTGVTGTEYYMDSYGYPTTGRSTTDPNDSTYIIFDVDDGPFTLTASAYGGNESASSRVMPNSVTYLDMLFWPPEYETNPTHPECE